MFLPGRSAEKEAAEKKKICARVENWCLEIIPDTCKEGAEVSIQEVQCGDPQCSPIDTVVTIFFTSGGQGMFGLPMEAKDVNPEDLKNSFPPADILEKWHRGEEAEWPPEMEEEPSDQNVELRFTTGTRVECRIGADEWAPGKVAEVWYREPNWPKGSFAPYKIHLEDGREIFAPADMDQIIRLNANPPTVA